MNKKKSLLTYIGPTAIRKGIHVLHAYRCRCGTIWHGRKDDVDAGKVVSCGCVRAENQYRQGRRHAKKIVQAITKHGLSQTPLYAVWREMLNRCYNPNYKRWMDYGGRGITVCREWKAQRNYAGLKAFVKWALANGYRKGLSLDRQKNDKGYSPSNCRFITNAANQLNKRSTVNLTFNGQTMTQKQWAEVFGVTYQAIRKWRKAGVWEEKFAQYLKIK